MACTQQIKIVATALALSTAAVSFIGNAKGEEALGVSVSRTDTQTAKRVSRKFTDSNGNVIGGPPAGCPRVAFCGCALSIEVFGKSVRDLWPARGWYRFARTHASPGAVGVRPHHVLKLISHVEGTTWLVFDPNSGGHKTRIHERDVRSYVFVDPNSRIVMQ